MADSELCALFASLSIRPRPIKKPRIPVTIESLPVEVLWEIVCQLHGTDPRRTGFMFQPVDPALCLVNRRWNQVFTPFLYSHFHFNGDPSKVDRLWNFLDAICSNPELASYVRGVVFTTTKAYDATSIEFGDPITFINRLSDLTRKNKFLFCEALADTGFHTVRDIMVSSAVPSHSDAGGPAGIWERYLAMLSAMIISHCINVETAHLHIGQSDCVLREVLQRTLNPPEPYGQYVPKVAFKKLTKLTLAPAHEVIPGSNNVPLGFGFEFEQLPALKELVVLKSINWLPVFHHIRNLNKTLPLDEQIPIPERSSPVERLTLTPLCGIYPLNLSALTCGMKNLRQLILTVPDVDIFDAGSATYGDVWAALSAVREQLEYLDLRQDVNTRKSVIEEIRWSRNREFCTSLSEFTALRALSISFYIVTWFSCKDHPSGTRMTCHLPPNIRSLGIYTDLAKMIAKDGETKDHVMSELIGTTFNLAVANHKLDTIYFDKAGAEHLPLEEFKRKAAVSKIKIHIGVDECFFHGGKNTVGGQCVYRRFNMQQAETAYAKHGAKRVLPKGLEVHGHVGEL
ncbi:hypothetical protein BDV18DRAFT_163930 [Aspergillus unguis]